MNHYTEPKKKMNRKFVIGWLGIFLAACICGVPPTMPATPDPVTPTHAPEMVDTTASEFACIPTRSFQTGTVVEIVDGDTIRVLIDDNLHTIRYIGIDTPENTATKEYYGQEATEKNAELVYGKQIALYKDVSETDRYGRLLRYVVLEGQFVNLILVRQGFARAVAYPPDTACAATLQAAEQEARATQAGIWNEQPAIYAPLLPLPEWRMEAICFCKKNVYNCADFKTQSEAQACLRYCIHLGVGDIHRLDGNNDGKACEHLP